MKERSADDVESETGAADDKHKLWMIHVYSYISRLYDWQSQESLTLERNKSFYRL